MSSWLGQALRATGAAIVVPVAVLLALALSGVGGAGLGGLGALGQIVEGPDIAGTNVGDDSDDEISEAVEELAAAGPPLRPGSGIGFSTDGDNGPGDGTPGTPPTGGPDPPDGPPGDPPTGGPNPPSDPGDPDDPGDPPEPPPPEDPGVVEGLGQTVDDVTSNTPVHPTVEDVIGDIVEACGRLNCP